MRSDFLTLYFAAAFVIIFLTMGVHAESIFKSKTSGFSFEYPSDWRISSSNEITQVDGNLSLEGSCSRISLNWIRDPGISSKNILNQIEKAYESNEIKILSLQPGEITSKGQRVGLLSIVYEFKGFRSAKHYAAWNSSRSDRFFLSSISSCIERSDQNFALFDHFIESFADGEGRGPIKIGPTSNGAWSMVLEDLLSSYHYADAKTLPSRTIHILITHILTPINGTFDLESQEIIFADPSQATAERAAAIWALLAHAGYEVQLIHRSGRIAVAVLDPSGNWQQISINPSSPEKILGVLVNSTEEAISYADFADMARENKLNSILNASSLVLKDSEPSSYVELRMPSEVRQSWLDQLQKILTSYNYDRNYEEKVFDCSDTAQICWNKLNEMGYDVRLMMSYKGHPLDPHMWIVLRYPYEADSYVPIETANIDETKNLIGLGRIVLEEDYCKGIMYNSTMQFSQLHPEEGIQQELDQVS